MVAFSEHNTHQARSFKQVLDAEDDPKKAIDDYLVSVYTTLQEIRQSTEQARTLTERRKSACEENDAQIVRFENLAKKALSAGNEDDARVFLAKKQELLEAQVELRQDFEAADAASDAMSEAYDDLVEHFEALKDRKEDLLLKLLEANVRTQAGSVSTQSQSADAALEAFSQIDEETTRLIDKAHALTLLDEGKSLQLEQLEQKYAT